MSNPAVYVLGETVINNMRIRIEDNLGESIHIHIGDFRIAVSIEEFYSIVEQFQKAADEILKYQGLKTDMFDYKAYDWDWLYRYESISKIEKKVVRIGDLLTKGESKVVPNIDVIVHVSGSRQYKALCGNQEELLRYKEKNEYGQSNLERLKNVAKYIDEKGYPYDDKYIIVNQYNQIYDGDHRAAYLLKLKGEDEYIHVVQITFEDTPTIEEQINNQEKLIAAYIEKNKKNEKPVYYWSENLNELDVSYSDFIKEMDNDNLNYFCINHFWSDVNGEHIADKVVVLQQDSMIEFCHKYNLSYYGKCIYRHFDFLYSMQRAVYVELQDYKILVFERLACKSKFENSLIPLDKSIQKYSEKFLSGHNVDKILEVIFVIVNSIVNGCGFEDEDKKFIRENILCLQNHETRMLLQTIFFGYSENLVSKLCDGDFDKAYSEYVSNINY